MNKQIVLLGFIFILNSCSMAFIDKVENLKPIEDYSTENVSIESSKVLDATITFMNDKVVKTKIQALKHLNGRLDEATITSLIAIYDKNGKRNFLKSSVIRKIELVDYHNQNRVFVNRGGASLQELVYDGKIKWYIGFGHNMYDYSTKIGHYFINEEGVSIKVGEFNSMKKKLKEVLSSKPNLVLKIDGMEMSRDNILNLLKEYDSE